MLSQKIAFRYMREAGTLSAPPDLLKKVTSFFVSKYAGHILYRAIGWRRAKRSVLQKLEKAVKYEKNLDRAFDTLNNLDLLEIPLNEEVVITVSDRPGEKLGSMGVVYLSYTIVRTDEKEWRVYGGENKYGKRFRATYDVYDFVFGNLIELTSILNKKAKEVKGAREDLVEATRLVKLCRKYTDKPKSYKHSARATIKYHLDGWEYEDMVPEEDGEHSLDAILFFDKHSRRTGQWSSYSNEFQVDIRSKYFHRGADAVSQFKDDIKWIIGLCRHEGQHVAQTLLSRYSGAQDAGQPDDSLRDPDYMPSGWRRSRQPHELRDVEFETRLSDDIEKFIAQARREAPKRLHRSYLRAWMADALPEDIEALESAGVEVPSRSFFSMLKEHQPDKWRKAKGKFVAALHERSFAVPSDRIALRLNKLASRSDETSKRLLREKLSLYRSLRDRVNKAKGRAYGIESALERARKDLEEYKRGLRALGKDVDSWLLEID